MPIKKMAAIAQPTPMPALAPVDSPDEPNELELELPLVCIAVCVAPNADELVLVPVAEEAFVDLVIELLVDLVVGLFAGLVAELLVAFAVVPLADLVSRLLLAVAARAGAVSDKNTAALLVSSESLAARRSPAGHPVVPSHASDTQQPRNGSFSPALLHVYQDPPVPEAQACSWIWAYSPASKLVYRTSACGHKPLPSAQGSDAQQPRNCVVLPWQT